MTQSHNEPQQTIPDADDQNGALTRLHPQSTRPRAQAPNVMAAHIDRTRRQPPEVDRVLLKPCQISTVHGALTAALGVMQTKGIPTGLSMKGSNFNPQNGYYESRGIMQAGKDEYARTMQIVLCTYGIRNKQPGYDNTNGDGSDLLIGKIQMPDGSEWEMNTVYADLPAGMPEEEQRKAQRIPIYNDVSAWIFTQYTGRNSTSVDFLDWALQFDHQQPVSKVEFIESPANRPFEGASFGNLAASTPQRAVRVVETREPKEKRKPR